MNHLKKYCILFLLLIPLLINAETGAKPHSVLSSGKWFKIGTTQPGLFRLTYDDFVAMGFDPAQIDPAGIRIFGNGGGILPENISLARPDDLLENSIEVTGSEDGRFDAQDLVIFYGDEPGKWTFDADRDIFVHQNNYYSDTVFFFVTVGTVPGKRIGTKASLTQSPNYFVNTYRDHILHEIDSLNLIRSGKMWVGEHFSGNSMSIEVPYNLSGIDSLRLIKLRLHLLGRSTMSSSFYVSDNHDYSSSAIDIAALTGDQKDKMIAHETTKTLSIYPAHTDFRLKIEYDPILTGSEGWLDYFEMTITKKLNFTGPQLLFRDPSALLWELSEFTLRSADSTVEIWDVTNRFDIKKLLTVKTDSTQKFRFSSDSIREYIAFDRSFFHKPFLSGPVPNQDLHASNPVSMLIITHPSIKAEAERLAQFRRSHDGLTVSVVSVSDIFNEFSSGCPDPAAIRDFAGMIYNRSGGEFPRYLLLFGDGSYDPKNRIPGNNSLIPTFQSNASLVYASTFQCEDFYTLLGNGEGNDADGTMDISIGRLPVTDNSQAEIVVDKIINYSTYSADVSGDWRSRFTIIADDEDQNMHFNMSEELTDLIEKKYPVVNNNKIYNDHYKMVPTSNGERLPQVNEAINKAIDDGTIIINYFGHGGEEGLSAEKILTVSDIQTWTNYNRLPVFLTATCEFSRFDNPERFTAGEMMMVHPSGGAIALLSTTRLSFGAFNFPLDTSFFAKLISTDGSPNPRLGDLVRMAKNEQDNNDEIKNFVLLGDPVQMIAFPEYNVVTTEINGQVTSDNDTLLGLSPVDIKGKLKDLAGNDLIINGKLKTKIFDKPLLNHTIGNHPPQSYSAPFYTQVSVIYEGECEVINGQFSFSLLVPKGINTSFGCGKISYYFMNDTTDAWGFDKSQVVGGQDPSIDPINAGPEIALYMDDYFFVSGGKTKSNTTLLAGISDDQGINTIGLGIGHEITCTLDDDIAHSFVMNDEFVYDEGSWKSGSFVLPFENLSPGRHFINVKAWDLYNNVSEKEISFWVSDNGTQVTDNISCYPNPFDNGIRGTTFLIRSSNPGVPGKLTLQVFNQSGELVKNIEESYTYGVPEEVTISWNGTSDSGSKLNSGLYLYRVTLPAGNGLNEQSTRKVLILN